MQWRTWSFGTNAYWKTGHIGCHERPTWLAVVEWLYDHTVSKGCNAFQWIKMPKWLHHMEDGEKISWRDWYGDLGQVWHCYICDPVFQWIWARPSYTHRYVETDYATLKKVFGADCPEHFKEDEEVAAQLAEQ